jgi:hypothetical protein
MKTLIKENTWLSIDVHDFGWGNGYVLISQDDLDSLCLGFDTCHYGDNIFNWTKERVQEQTNILKSQLLQHEAILIKSKKMEQLTDYQTQRIEALERENAKLQSQLNEAKEILTQLLKDLQDGSEQ